MRWGILPAVILVVAIVVPSAQGRLAGGQICPGEQSLGDGATAYAAVARGRVQARAYPNGERVRAFGRENRNGARTVFGVLGMVTGRACRPSWYRVQLAARPNGAAGYVPAHAVELRVVRTRIQVDLSERRLTFFRDGRPVLTATTAVGAPGTPTPTGSYYVNQRLRADDRSGPFGPGAIGISAFSPTLTQWAQGGPIAVHGTDDPSSVGRAISHGCLRVQNPVLRRLFRTTELGSPVIIHA
jgi:hypothetical protein